MDEQRGGRADWEHGLQEMGCKWVQVEGGGCGSGEEGRGGNAGMKGSMCNGRGRTAWRKVRSGEKGAQATFIGKGPTLARQDDVPLTSCEPHTRGW